MAAIWAEHGHDRFTAATGGPPLRPGALRIVFCQPGTPAERWNVYDGPEIRLVVRATPTAACRFIHKATGDRAQAKLFAACRAASVAVLGGSSEKMGASTNVQAREPLERCTVGSSPAGARRQPGGPPVHDRCAHPSPL